MKDLARALKELFKSSCEIKVIGTRHGEKLYETLLSREEMVKTVKSGNYYQVPMDNRDLNYNKFFIEGEKSVSDIEDYTSHNTERLSVLQVKELLLKLSLIRDTLHV